jgi:hypothetical protein
MMFKKAKNLIAVYLASVIALGFVVGGIDGIKTNNANAAFNHQINYQGKLVHPTTNIEVPDGNYNMEFRFCTVSDCSSGVVWTETCTLANRIAVSSGLFSHLLGSVTSISSVDFNQTLYLGVNIGGTADTPSWDGEMAPRKKLGAVPAAFEADKLDGVDSTSFLRSDEADTMSASDAGTLLTVTQSGAGASAQIGDGTDYLQIDNVGNIVFVDANGGASITGPAGGTLAMTAGASQALNITANAASTWKTISADLTIQTETSGALSVSSAGTLALASTDWGITTTGVVSNISGYTQTDGAFSHTGSTSSLDLTGAINWDTDSTMAIGAQSYGLTADGGNIAFTASGDLDLTATNFDIDTGTIDLSTQTTAITLNAAADALNIDSNTLSIDASADRVGIGIAAPSYKLDVDGTIRAQNFITTGGYPVNDILLPQDVQNYSIGSLTGSVGLDVQDWEEKVSATLFESAATNYVSATALANGNVFIAYQDGGNLYRGTFAIYDFAGNQVKAPTVFESAWTFDISATTLIDGNVLIAYRETTTDYGSFVIYDSAGNLVKSATVFESATALYISTTVLTNGNVLIAYEDDANSDYGTFVIYDAVGNSVKAATIFESAAVKYVSAVSLSNGNVLIAYQDDANSDYGTFVIYDSVGNLVKSATIFESAATNYISASALSNGNVLIAYQDDANSDYGTFVIYDSVGNLVKSATIFESAATNYISASSLSNGNVLIAYEDDANSDYGTFVIYDAVGNSVKAATIFESAAVKYVSAVSLSNGNVLIAYQDDANSDYGTFVIWKGSAEFDNGLLVSRNSATTTAFAIQQAGAGASAQIGDGTDYLQIDNAGNILFVDDSDGASITGPANGTLVISAGASQALNLTANLASTWKTTAGQLNITTDGADDIVLTSGKDVVISTAAFDLDNTGAITIGTDSSEQDITFEIANFDVNSTGTITLSGNTVITGTLQENLTDNTADAFDLQEGTNNYININTTNDSEKIQFGNATTNPDYTFLGSGSLGVGTTASAKIHALSTTEQLRLGYDATSYLSVTGDATGRITFDAVDSEAGSDTGFLFQDPIYQPVYGTDDGLVLNMDFSEGHDLPISTTTYDKSEFGNDGTLNGFNGTADSGTTTTLVDNALATTDDVYNGLELYITGGTNSGEHQTISDYDQASDTITVDTAFTSAIDNTSTYIVGWGQGKYGSGLQFDGANDYVNCGKNASLNITNAITISAWVKSNNNSPPDKAVVSRFSDSNNRFYITNQNNFQWYIRKLGTFYGIQTTTVQTDIWYHIVFLTDGTNMYSYLNGVNVTTAIDGFNSNVGSLPDLSSADLLIGSDTPAGGYYFNGSIDSVRIYNRALDADEVKAHYLRGEETHTDLALDTSATAGNLFGNRIILTDTGVVTTGTDTSYGEKIYVTRTGATGGTINTYGIHSTVTADVAGAGDSTATAGYFSATGADNNYGIIVTNGNVGIAETVPISQLSVGAGSDTAVTDGTTAVSTLGINLSMTDDAAYAMGILNAHADGDGLLIQAGDASDDYALRVEDYDSANDLFVVRGDGNVGIGTTAPDGVLELNMGTDKEFRLSYNDADGSATDYSKFEVGDDGALTITTVDADAAEGDIILVPDGFVGIGDSTPSSLLTVGTADEFQVASSGATSITPTTDVVPLAISRNAAAAASNLLTITESAADATGTGLAISQAGTAGKVATFTGPAASGTVNLVEISGTTTGTGLFVNQGGTGNVADFQASSTSVLTVEGADEITMRDKASLAFGDINDNIIDDMESAEVAEWAESDNGNTDVSTETTIVRTNDGAMKITTTASSSNTDTITKTIASADFSDNDRIGFWIRSTQTGQIISIECDDDDASTDPHHDITIDAANKWQYEEWDISSYGTDINAVTGIIFIIDDDTNEPVFYIDQLREYDKDNRSGEMFVDGDGHLVLAGEKGVEFQANIASSLPGLSIDSAIVEVNQPFAVNVAGDVGINYDLYFAGTGTSSITSAGPLVLAAGDPNHSENLTITTQSNLSGGDSGRATGGAATTLTDSTKTWTADEWIGGTVSIVSGDGASQTQLITDNDATSVTVADWDATLGDPAANSYYTINYARAGDVLVNIGQSHLQIGGFKILGNDSGSYVFKVSADGDVEIGGAGLGGSDLLVKQNISLTGGNLTIGQLDISDAGTPSTSVTASGGSCADDTYYYKITAVNDNGETTGCAQFSKATGAGSSQVTIAWTAVNGATGYKIYRSTEDDDWDGDANDSWVDGKVISVLETTYTDDCSGDTASQTPPTTNTTGGGINYPSTGGPKRSIILTSAGGVAPDANGAAQTKIDGTNHTYYVLDYDDTTDESAFWQWTMPDSYDDGTIDITYYWEAAATTGEVGWCFQAKGLSANSAEDIDSALSSAVCEVDTAQGNANDLASVTESAATSNFAAGEYVTFKVFRDADQSTVGAGNDDMTGDARLVKVKIEYSVDTESD